MFGNYKQLFNTTLNNSLTPSSPHCPKHPLNKLVYVCIADSCNTPICIKCQQIHTKHHLGNATLEKYISYSEWMRGKNGGKEWRNGGNGVQEKDRENEVLRRVREEKKVYLGIVEEYFKEMEGRVGRKEKGLLEEIQDDNFKYFTKDKDNTRNKTNFTLVTNQKNFTQLLKNCVYLDPVITNITSNSNNNKSSLDQLFKQDKKSFQTDKYVTKDSSSIFNRPFTNYNENSMKPSTAGDSFHYRPSSSDRTTAYDYQFKRPPVNPRLSLEETNRTFIESEKYIREETVEKANFTMFERQSPPMEPVPQHFQQKTTDQPPTGNTISKLTDLFWNRQQPQKAYFPSKDKPNYTQDFTKRPFNYFRNL